VFRSRPHRLRYALFPKLAGSQTEEIVKPFLRDAGQAAEFSICDEEGISAPSKSIIRYQFQACLSNSTPERSGGSENVSAARPAEWVIIPEADPEVIACDQRPEDRADTSTDPDPDLDPDLLEGVRR